MKQERHELGKSSEDYLESILRIIREKGACRPTDIAELMNFSKPSVSVALKKLEEEGYIHREDWRISSPRPGSRRRHRHSRSMSSSANSSSPSALHRRLPKRRPARSSM